MSDTPKKHVINEIPKSWWAGDERVEPYMKGVRAALDRANLPDMATRTDIYNRAYEAVYDVILDFDKGKGL